MAQNSLFWAILSYQSSETLCNSSILLGTVELHIPVLFWPDCNILGTQNWLKTAQNSLF